MCVASQMHSIKPGVERVAWLLVQPFITLPPSTNLPQRLCTCPRIVYHPTPDSPACEPTDAPVGGWS